MDKQDGASPRPVTPEEVGGDETVISAVDEAKLLRKLDLHLIPLIMALYLFSFLDR